MSQQDIKEVLERIKSGWYSQKDEEIAKKWLFILDQADQVDYSEEELNAISEEMWASLKFEKSPVIQPKRLWLRIAAAAAVLLICCTVGYYLIDRKSKQADIAAVRDIAPGTHQAILTLSNGKRIVLHPGRKGKVASDSKADILVNSKGQVTYITDGVKSNGATIYNTLSTPIGSRSDITLSDGTEVSLDAGSSIVYPVLFGSGERIVKITGQVYLKVKHDPLHPFKVLVKGFTIYDIGTEFNINAYNDESRVRTTLVEGSIKVNDTPLQPGQQATVSNNKVSVRTADVEAVAAWKEDNFLFRNQDLETTMRQIARWYNVSVVYDHAPMDFRIWADISRNRNLSVILRSIEGTGRIKFKIDGRKVIVSK